MQNVTANIVLSGMTVVACTVLAILLYVMLGFRENTHPLIYVTAGLLIAMGCWHIQTFWRSLLLRKHFKLTEKARNSGAPEPSLAGPEPRELPEANFEDMVPPSVVERTTRKLKHDLPKAGK
ncbi:MAG: hypothetical protein UZ17_ACD001002401 [Acidobacteria bacterium OLB17]|nr:MAG: hypothetical protein UZ17_ACD001002401 [Acidobacteria bacterium OLB17]